MKIIKITLLILLQVFFVNLHVVSQEKIKIGIISTASQEYYDDFSRTGVNAIKLARNNYLKENPLNSVKLIFKKTGFKKTAEETIRELVEDKKVNAIIINTAIEKLDDNLSKIEKEKVPVISFIKDRDSKIDFLFEIAPSSSSYLESKALGSFLREKQVDNITTIILDNYASDETAELEDFCEGYGECKNNYNIHLESKNFSVGKLIFEEKDAVVEAKKIIKLNPQHILLTIPLFDNGRTVLVQIANALLREGYSAKKISFLHNFSLFVDKCKEKGINPHNFSDSYTIESIFNFKDNTALVKAYKKAFEEDYKKFGYGPSQLSYGYDTFSILAKTFSSDPETYISNIKKLQFDGMSGHISYDENGHRKPEFKIVKVEEYLKNNPEKEVVPCKPE